MGENKHNLEYRFEYRCRGDKVLEYLFRTGCQLRRDNEGMQIVHRGYRQFKCFVSIDDTSFALLVRDTGMLPLEEFEEGTRSIEKIIRTAAETYPLMEAVV